jgi:uncharacterized coiled-coil protein SlyX
VPKKPTKLQVTALADKAADAWRDRGGNGGAREEEQDRRLERRLERVEERLEHLEAALEGLQDALYRQAQRDDESLEDLRRRTDPERIARDLSDDARRRGL